jgi:hypothetical protein
MGKKCNTCGEVKDRSEFYTNHSYADGKRSDCKACCKKKAQQREEKNQSDIYHYVSEREHEIRMTEQ